MRNEKTPESYNNPKASSEGKVNGITSKKDISKHLISQTLQLDTANIFDKVGVHG